MKRSLALLPALYLAGISACATDSIAPNGAVPVGNHVASAKSSGVVVVTESDISRQADNTFPRKSWVLYQIAGGTGAFVLGPSDPPLGAGSFEFTTVAIADHATLFNFDHIGTRLVDINAISYATYGEPSSVGALGVARPSINIAVNPHDPSVAGGGFTTLVFEPYLNPLEEAVVPGVWQTWDAYAGNWWSTKPIPGALCGQACVVPWSVIIAANPNATILGGFGVNQGSSNPNLVAATDALTLGVDGTSVTYDFEPTKKDCKHDESKTMKAEERSRRKECKESFNDKSDKDKSDKDKSDKD